MYHPIRYRAVPKAVSHYIKTDSFILSEDEKQIEREKH